MAHHHESDYPESFPMACVTSAFQILSSGQGVEQRKTLALDLWNVTGFGLRIGIGVPDEPFMANASAADLGVDNEEAATAELRKLCDAMASKSEGRFAAANFGKMDFRALLRFVIENWQVILPLFLSEQS